METLARYIRKWVSMTMQNNITKKDLQLQNKLVTEMLRSPSTDTLEICFNLFESIRRPKNIWNTHLPQAKNMVIKKDTPYCSLGTVFKSVAEFRNAKKYYEEALAISKEIGDKRGGRAQYGNLAAVLREFGEIRRPKNITKKRL